MKSKNIPADIRAKSIEEAQEEVNEILEKLENSQTNLEQSQDQYNRMMLLNYHIQDKFKEKAMEIKNSTISKKEEKT